MPERMRVLIADDDVGTAQTLGDILEGSGYAVEIALDGPQALARFEAHPCDVAFLDVRMPGMTGIEVFRRLKGFGAVPAVLMTAYVQPDVIAEAKREGVLAVLIKPLPLERVLSFMAALEEGLGQVGTEARQVHARRAAACLRDSKSD